MPHLLATISQGAAHGTGNRQRIGDDDADVAVRCGSFLDSAAFAQSGMSLEAIPVTTIS